MFCDAHYSYECGCGEPEDRAVRPLPAAVWVVVEIYSKSVRLNDKAATSPIAGRAAIFAKPEITQQVAARIVGVFAEETDARKAIPHTEGAEYVVGRHEVGQAPAPLPAAVVVESRCIQCGIPWPTTFCRTCEQQRFALMRERDSGIITELVPAQ